MVFPELKSHLDDQLEFLGFNHSTELVQLVCLLPVGILDLSSLFQVFGYFKTISVEYMYCKLALQAKWTSTENISFTICSQDSFPLCYMKLSLRAVSKVPLAVKSSYLVGSNLTFKHHNQSNKVFYDFHSMRQCILKLFLPLTLLLHHRFSIGTLHRPLPTRLLTF